MNRRTRREFFTSMELYDECKYSSLNFALTNKEKDGHSYIRAMALTKRLEEFKKEYM